jgi:hypothetical protein
MDPEYTKPALEKSTLTINKPAEGSVEAPLV